MSEQDIYDYLYKKWVSYTLSHDKKEKELIEYCVRTFVDNNVSSSLYHEFDVSKTGDRLFSHGFFEVDLKRALSVLENKLNSNNS